MKKNIIMILTFFVVFVAFSKEKKSENLDKTSKWTPFRICFTRELSAYPKHSDVYGVNFGVPFSFKNKEQSIKGIDIGMIKVKDKAEGMQLGLSNWSKGSYGYQLSVLNIVNEFEGVQTAVINEAKDSDIIQVGVVNLCRQRTEGVQIGVLNFMGKGFLPVSPLFNYSTEFKLKDFVKDLVNWDEVF